MLNQQNKKIYQKFETSITKMIVQIKEISKARISQKLKKKVYGFKKITSIDEGIKKKF